MGEETSQYAAKWDTWTLIPAAVPELPASSVND